MGCCSCDSWMIGNQAGILPLDIHYLQFRFYRDNGLDADVLEGLSDDNMTPPMYTQNHS